jgi:hypothetical protein
VQWSSSQASLQARANKYSSARDRDRLSLFHFTLETGTTEAKRARKEWIMRPTRSIVNGLYAFNRRWTRTWASLQFDCQQHGLSYSITNSCQASQVSLSRDMRESKRGFWQRAYRSLSPSVQLTQKTVLTEKVARTLVDENCEIQTKPHDTDEWTRRKYLCVCVRL